MALRGVVVGVCSAAITSCSTGVGKRYGLPEGDRPVVRTAALTPLWGREFYVPPAFAFKQYDSGTPAVSPDGSRVYVGAADGFMRCLRTRTGEVVWEYETAERIEAAPKIHDGSIYFGSFDGKVTRLDAANGQERWKYATGSPVLATPIVSGGRVFFTNDKDVLFALDAKTGKYLWKKARSQSEEFTVTGQAGVLEFEGRLYTGFSDGNLVCLSPEDGATIWTKYLGEPSRRLVDVDTTPVVEGGTLYAAAFRGGLYALDPETGLVKWTYPVEGARRPVVRRNTLWITTSDRQIHCLNSNDGSVLWKRELPRGSLSEPMVDGNWLFLSTGDALAVFQAASGALVRLWPTVEGVSGAPASGAGRLFAMSNGGRVLAWSIRP